MAYNNYFPVSYNPVNPQQLGFMQPSNMNNNGNIIGMQSQAAMPNNSNIVWVQGESGAKSYMVAPGNSVLLMDSEDNVFFMKWADQTGMPMLKKFRYEEVSEELNQSFANKDITVPSVDMSDYLTREEFEQRMSEMNKTSQSSTSSRKGKGENDGKSVI